jgi:hypothetical protein
MKIKIYRTTVLSVVYEYGAWFLTYRLGVFENRVLRKTFRHKTDKIPQHWRKLRYKELHYLHSSLNFIWVFTSRKVRWTEHMDLTEGKRKA